MFWDTQIRPTLSLRYDSFMCICLETNKEHSVRYYELSRIKYGGALLSHRCAPKEGFFSGCYPRGRCSSEAWAFIGGKLPCKGCSELKWCLVSH